MYEQLLINVKNYFKQSKRINESKDKLHQLFQDNITNYKFASWLIHAHQQQMFLAKMNLNIT